MQDTRTCWLLLSLVSLGIVACESEADRPAVAGATPSVDVPIGPPPGPDPEMIVASNPFAENRIAIAEGRKLFVWYNCAGCHGDHGGGGMGPSLRDVTWIYGNSDAHIFSSIALGRAYGMPAWGTKLPEEQIWMLVAYIKSMRTPLEAEPPPNNPTWPLPRAEVTREQ